MSVKVLKIDLSRIALPFILAVGAGLGGCAHQNTNLKTCGATTTYSAGGALAMISASFGGSAKPDHDCTKAKDAVTIVLNKLENGEYSVWGLKFGQIYYEKADPKVKKFFDEMLAEQNLTVSDLKRLEAELNLPLEVRPAAGGKDGTEKKFVCRVFENARRCYYVETAKAGATVDFLPPDVPSIPSFPEPPSSR